MNKLSNSRTALRFLAIQTIAVSTLVIAGVGVHGALNATAVGTEFETNAGTLSLTLVSAAGSAGFGADIDNLAPGDVVNRYVDLENGGNIDGANLKLQVGVVVGDNAVLVGNSVKALTVRVKNCSTAWSNGLCAGSSTVLTSTPVGDLATAVSLTNMATFAAGTTAHLQITVTLPNQDETTVNGVLPSNSIQGGAAHLTFTFIEDQRVANEQNS